MNTPDTFLHKNYFTIPQATVQAEGLDCRYEMILYPFLLLAAGVVFEYSGVDLWWVSHFYDYQNHLWPFENHWLFNTVIHKWGQNFSKGMVLIWLILFARTFYQQSQKKFRKILVYFLLAAAAGPALIALGKACSHIYTPWDLVLFGGRQPYIRLLDTVPAGAPVGHAFPAGHSSGGFAFVSLYFVLHHFKSSRRGYGLMFGLCLGLIFGLGQQVRGAHFPSHDFFSLAICWYAAMAMYLLFYPKEWGALKKW